MTDAPIMMPKEFWQSGVFSIARRFGGIKAFNREYIIVDKRGRDVWECSREAHRAGRPMAISADEPADLIDKKYKSVYKKVGRNRFIEMVKQGLSLKEMKEEIKKEGGKK